jgi:ABC-type spermidine/putrescine transport system permease subunit II
MNLASLLLTLITSTAPLEPSNCGAGSCVDLIEATPSLRITTLGTEFAVALDVTQTYVHTLTEASQSLGAGWIRTLWRVILPNVLTGALAGAFLTFALVMGEFTMASLALFNTFPTYINYIGQTKANPAAALTIISFGITWLALLGILLVGRRPGRAAVQVGGAR